MQKSEPLVQYHVIDMTNIPDHKTHLVDSAFGLWKAVYSEELERRGLKLCIEDFWNCRLLCIIEDRGVIIGTHNYNVFDLRTRAQEHKYFNDVTPERIEILKSQKMHRLMSMEYLLVNPLFRGSKSSVRWGEVIIGLGFNVMVHSPWDGIIGIARADKNVNTMGKRMGCSETESITKNQTPCKVMIMGKSEIKDNVDKDTQKIINNLWRDRFCSSPWNAELTPIKKSA